MTLNWAKVRGTRYEELVCNPNHVDTFLKKLPAPSQVECQRCGLGMKSDDHGNCEFCESGTFQPRDYRPESIQDKQNLLTDNIYDHYEWLLNTKNTVVSAEKSNDPNHREKQASSCQICHAGTFANKIVELSQFDSIPQLFNE